VISESPLTSSPRTPRITSPRAKQHTVSGNSSPRSRKYGSSGLMLRAEPAPLILQTRQSVCGAEGEVYRTETQSPGTQQTLFPSTPPLTLKHVQRTTSTLSVKCQRIWPRAVK